MTTTQTTTIPYGDDGALSTVDTMRRLINDATANPTVVAFARQLAYQPSPRPMPQLAVARTIAAWLRGAWRYVDDPYNRELLRSPEAMLLEYDQAGVVFGDCDEAATLGAALGMSVGIQTSLILLGFQGINDGVFSHVYAVLLPSGGPRITLDVTKPLPGTPVPLVVQAVEVSV